MADARQSVEWERTAWISMFVANTVRKRPIKYQNCNPYEIAKQKRNPRATKEQTKAGLRHFYHIIKGK